MSKETYPFEMHCPEQDCEGTLRLICEATRPVVVVDAGDYRLGPLEESLNEETRIECTDCGMEWFEEDFKRDFGTWLKELA